MNSIVIFVSGNGTNLQYIIDSIYNKSLEANIACVISNKKSYALYRAQIHKIPISICKTEKEIIKYLNGYKFELIVLAGYMRILSKEFIDFYNKLSIPIINLHPALPGMFPGKNAIKQAFDAYKYGLISKTGVMVHYVTAEVDAGEVIDFKKTPIFQHDTLESLTERIQKIEKDLLINAIKSIINRSHKLISKL